MANEIQEFFLGQNKQEIENERKKIKALMGLFPYSMGNTDQTNYILRKDGNQKQKGSFGSNAIDKPDKIVISNEGEKSQEQNRGKMPKIPDYGNRNIETPFTGSGFMQAGSLNKLNNTKRDNVSFALGKQKNIDNTMPRTAVNGNFRLDSINTSDHSDLLWSDRKQEKTYYNQKPGIYGIQPTINYSKQINELKSQIPQKALSILNELDTEVVVLDNLHFVYKNGTTENQNGVYSPKSKKIYIDSKHFDTYTLISEILHATQDRLGMNKSGRSNLEFQEHVLKDLYFNQRYRKTMNPKYLKGFSTTDDFHYIDFINDAFDENNILNLNYFLNRIDSYFNEFQHYYSQSNSYQEPEIEHYDYNWIELLNLFGIEYK